MKKLMSLAIIGASVGLAACSSANSNTAATTNAGGANRAATTTTSNPNGAAANTTAGGGSAPAAGGDETPALVKAALPGAQSFTVQHKDIPPAAIAQIEKDSGARVPDKDHHSYLAFSTTGGTRKQIGAATLVKASGRDVVVVYESKDGIPMIKEVRAEAVPAGFLAQFAGKGHDNEFVLGSDIKASGADEATAKAITEAVRVDAMTMQALYGKAHSH